MPTQQIDHDPENGCPKCGGALWDNRATKKNPKAPDYKCRDRNCDGVIWPPKGGARPAAPATQQKQPYSAGPHIEGIDGPRPIAQPEYGDVPAQQAAVDALRAGKLDGLFSLYRTCFAEAVSVSKGLPNATPEAVAAMCATLFIAAKDRHAA